MGRGPIRVLRGGPALLLLAGLAACLAWRFGGTDVGAAMAGARAWALLHPVSAAAAFAVAYVGVAALGVPAVAAMTVAAGALFGFWVGAPLAIASKPAGATIAMLVARHVLRDRIAACLPGLALRFEAAAGADGAALLFAARLAPFAPFALVNLAAGLSPMPARTFAAVTAAGALPLALVYVSAGAAIATVRSPADVLTPGLVAALTLAGAAPLLLRACAARIRRIGQAFALFGPQ